MKKNKVKRVLSIIAFIITTIIIVLIVIALRKGLFSSPDLIIKHVKKYGVFAPISFILLQVVQVVLPVVPGGISSFAGVSFFGSIWGFVYNYIGLVIGSFISFLLAKKFGIRLISQLFKEETINKYIKYISNKKFEKIFLFAIVFPFFPDDLLCYIAGLSKIKIKKFIFIIIIGRPVSLIAYSILIEIFHKLF